MKSVYAGLSIYVRKFVHFLKDEVKFCEGEEYIDVNVYLRFLKYLLFFSEHLMFIYVYQALRCLDTRINWEINL